MKTGSEFQKVRMLFQSLNSYLKGQVTNKTLSADSRTLKVKDYIKLISEAYNLIFESISVHLTPAASDPASSFINDISSLSS